MESYLHCLIQNCVVITFVSFLATWASYVQQCKFSSDDASAHSNLKPNGQPISVLFTDYIQRERMNTTEMFSSDKNVSSSWSSICGCSCDDLFLVCSTSFDVWSMLLPCIEFLSHFSKGFLIQPILYHCSGFMPSKTKDSILFNTEKNNTFLNVLVLIMAFSAMQPHAE